jgi:hypothetical protein
LSERELGNAIGELGTKRPVARLTNLHDAFIGALDFGVTVGRMKRTIILSCVRRYFTPLLLTALTAVSSAAATDLSYPPATSAGHDFNHAPVGQSFTAVASNVHGGIFLADDTSFTAWLATIYPGQITPGSYPYTVAPSITVRIDLLAGEGPDGAVLHSVTRTLTAPFMGFVDVDYGAAGVTLTVGQKYSILVTDISGQSYPQGVTGWVVPAVTDSTSGSGEPVYDSNGNVVGYMPYGAYTGGLPIVQGTLVTNDAGVGDTSFQVIDNGTAPTVQTVSGVNAVITAFVARDPGYIVINGGNNLLDHLWTTNLTPANTTFLGGLTNWYQTGLLVDYTGTVSPDGVILTQLTVKPPPDALVISTTSLPNGTAGVPYSAPIAVTGGLAPYSGSISGLPAGLTFDGLNITGTPTSSGVSNVTVTVNDALGHSASSTATLTINPAPSTYTIVDEAKGRISAIGAGYLMVGSKKLIWNSSTTIIVNTPKGIRSVIDSYVKVNMKVQWKGLRDAATNTVLTSKLEIN